MGVGVKRNSCSTGRYRRARRSRAPTSMRPIPPDSQGAGLNYTNLRVEPPDHAVGRSRGGLSTKIHQLVDGAGRPLGVMLTPSQAGDSPMFLPLVAQLRVSSPSGRPRTRPERVRAEKAYSSRAIRGHLRDRGIQAVIAEPGDQIGHRKRRGSRRGRPPAFDKADYCERNVIERAFCSLKQCRGLATRHDKLAITDRAAAVLHATITWSAHLSDPPWAGQRLRMLVRASRFRST